MYLSYRQPIMRDPSRLSLHGEKRQIYALFTDLEGFTKLSHAIEPEMVAAPRCRLIPDPRSLDLRGRAGRLANASA